MDSCTGEKSVEVPEPLSQLGGFLFPSAFPLKVHILKGRFEEGFAQTSVHEYVTALKPNPKQVAVYLCSPAHQSAEVYLSTLIPPPGF